MLYLSINKAMSAIDAAIEERGADYVYPGSEPGKACKYVHGAKMSAFGDDFSYATPGCLVGVAMNKLGVSLEELYMSNEEDAAALVQNLEDIGNLVADADAVNFLLNLQQSQDQGHPWGKARFHALKGEYLDREGVAHKDKPVVV